MRIKFFSLATTALAVCGMIVADASAQVLYSDTFSRVTGSGDGNGDPNGAADNFSDWSTNDNGLGGANAQAWVSGPSRAGGGRNAVTDGDLGISHGTTSFYDFDASALAPLGFTVALDFSRFVVAPDPGPGAGGFIAFGLGIDAGTAITSEFATSNLSDWSILFQQMANGNTGNAAVSVDGAQGATFDYGNPDVPHSLLLTITPDTPGAYGDADGISVDVLVDGSLSQNFTTTGGANFGSFSVSANNFDTRYIDNLVVTAIPEPTALALFATGCAVVAFGRRRNGIVR